ncbi:MAG: ImmA/IrrE family metallo-endopeptidase [Rikenellaceae bacterium]
MTFEQLAQIAEDENIEFIEMTFPGDLKGLCKYKKIGINKKLNSTEKRCVLAEELGHYYTTVGNITDLKSVCNRKQEIKARKYAFETLVPLKSIIKASYEGCINLYELAEYLDVTEKFLSDTLEHYQRKYGLYIELDNYCIYFNPLTVCKYNYE